MGLTNKSIGENRASEVKAKTLLSIVLSRINNVSRKDFTMVAPSAKYVV